VKHQVAKKEMKKALKMVNESLLIAPVGFADLMQKMPYQKSVSKKHQR
jgi:hypothetical protein